MLEKALTGNRSYFGWVAVLLIILAIGFLNYLKQLGYGLGITGMSRDVSWGLYIGQFTFLVGVAASAVMLVLPYYLHNYKVFGKITLLGEFLAVASVTMCLSFIIVDLGQPSRAFNVLLHPTPNSVLFWDMVVLNGYLFLNIVIGWTVLAAERKGAPPPRWVKPLIYISIPWAVSIHTVTAFLYAGLPGRGFWLTAVMAPRFLGSAFASGPALLILFCMFLRKYTKFDAGWEAIQTLAKIVTYAMIISVFFVLCELFTVYYSQIPEHMSHFNYIFWGLHGHGNLQPWMWTSAILAFVAIGLLINPKTRNNEKTLPIACAAAFIALWIEKGGILVITGYTPSPLETITEYHPTAPEVSITLGVWALGILILTILYKVALSVKEQSVEIPH
ncbi:MAG TPA: NrfD/PsrC family molybdoenzyme membrane anchor subunit [Desulfomonilaceae bacterium]|nr:NrfD/PsrC family molybdoenzyme membrane anchor subunit [Desulfomonilaceae bacterium]